MSQEKKQKLKEYQKNYRKAKTSQSSNYIFYGFNSVCYSLAMHY